MKEYEELVADINKYCMCSYTATNLAYDDIAIANFVAVWCMKNNVLVDTLQWDKMIDHLWSTLDQDKLKLEFENKKDFDNSCCRYLI